MNVTCIVVDNGEDSLEECILSLRNQTLKPYILVVGGPNTDYSLARELADDVLGPVEGIGRARVEGVLKSDSPMIVCCDSDSIYHESYVYFVVEDLKSFKAVKAGTVLPKRVSPLGIAEMIFTPVIPYEYTLSFRREDFLDAGIHLEDYSDPREDIGWYVSLRLFPILDPRLVVYTRMPTRNAKIISEIPLIPVYLIRSIGVRT
ncbi:MAG: hypothetical protein DRP01_09480 [Archaeoglobales archaeon]|nr:MAG: hypothetical protein DRP01_09480 [Archaeoglobales archaeon]